MNALQFSKLLSDIQSGFGWVTLALVLATSLVYGANDPILWVFFSFAVLLLVTAHVGLAILRAPAPALTRAQPLFTVYGAVLVWALVQALLPVPGGLAHPSWEAVADIAGSAARRISGDPEQGAHFILRLSAYGAIAWIMAASALRTKRAWTYLKVIAWFSTALAAYGLAMWSVGLEASLDRSRPVPGYVTATFVNRNSYAFYAAMGLIVNLSICLHMLFRYTPADSGRDAVRTFLEAFFSGAWLYAVGVLICALAVILTESRAGAGAAGIGVLVFLIARGWRQPRRLVPLLLIPLPILTYVVLSFGSGTIARFGEADLGGRIAVYSAIIENLGERLWLGHGLGAFHDTFRPHLPLEAATAEWDVAHNSYLENLWELGLVAALTFYGVLVAVIWRLALGTVVRRHNVGIPAMALGVIAAGAVHSTVEFPLQIPAVAALFAALIGIGWAQSFGEDERATPHRLVRKSKAVAET